MSSNSCSPSGSRVTPCAMLDSTIEALQKLMTGDSVKSISSRERNVSFNSVTMTDLRNQLASMVQNKKVFGTCSNYETALALAGIPSGRSPGVLSGSRMPDPCCGPCRK